MTATLGKRTETLASLKGYRREPLTQKDILRLRELVKCERCGAVPTETGEVREVLSGKGDGEMVTLPVVVTTHAEGCAGAQKMGRPKREPKLPQVPAGPCEHCGTEMMASAAHAKHKRFCTDTCRTAARRRAS
jgi:hypothetical protein